MYRALFLSVLAGLLLISILAACGQAGRQTTTDAANDQPGTATTTLIPSAATMRSATATPAADTLPGTDLVPAGMEPITFPPVTVDRDEMIAAALRYTAQREAVLSGSPEVVGATQATPPYLNAMGLSIGNMSPACLRPMYLVVLKGDFDGRSLVVGFGRQDKPNKISYIGYVFDQAHGAPGSIIATFLSPDGSGFRQILNDSSLPVPKETLTMDPKPPYLSCVDVTITGEQEATPVATPVP